MTLPTIPPRDPDAGRQAEAVRLRLIVEPPHNDECGICGVVGGHVPWCARASYR